MTNKILADLEFSSIISESQAQTQTGVELLNKYKVFLLANESSCTLVNNFIKEASQCRYDNGVNEALTLVTDFVNNNKTVWALASACESINSNISSYNYLNRNATKQVEKLLEMDEENVVKYIKAGALKNVMFCESFRNIAHQVFKAQPMIEYAADATIEHPISLVENVGDGYCFEIASTLYKMGDDKTVQEAQWNEVSNTFKIITSILESNNTTVDLSDISIKAGNAVYTIKEADKCIRTSKNQETEMTTEQLREHNRLVIMSTNPNYRNQMAQLLEGIALITENYNNIVNMDNVSIYTTNKDKFVIIESEDNMYATSLASTHNPKWTINENVVDALSFIKSKTNVNLSEQYSESVAKHMETASAQEQEQLSQEIKEQKMLSYKDRIASLTEKFKNDPVKLGVLSKLAQELSDSE